MLHRSGHASLDRDRQIVINENCRLKHSSASPEVNVLQNDVRVFVGHSNSDHVPLRKLTTASGARSGRSASPIAATPHARGRVKTRASRERAALFSLWSFSDGGRQYFSFFGLTISRRTFYAQFE